MNELYFRDVTIPMWPGALPNLESDDQVDLSCSASPRTPRTPRNANIRRLQRIPQTPQTPTKTYLSFNPEILTIADSVLECTKDFPLQQLATPDAQGDPFPGSFLTSEERAWVYKQLGQHIPRELLAARLRSKMQRQPPILHLSEYQNPPTEYRGSPESWLLTIEQVGRQFDPLCDESGEMTKKVSGGPLFDGDEGLRKLLLKAIAGMDVRSTQQTRSELEVEELHSTDGNGTPSVRNSPSAVQSPGQALTRTHSSLITPQRRCPFTTTGRPVRSNGPFYDHFGSPLTAEDLEQMRRSFDSSDDPMNRKGLKGELISNTLGNSFKPATPHRTAPSQNVYHNVGPLRRISPYKSPYQEIPNTSDSHQKAAADMLLEDLSIGERVFKATNMTEIEPRSRSRTTSPNKGWKSISPKKILAAHNRQPATPKKRNVTPKKPSWRTKSKESLSSHFQPMLHANRVSSMPEDPIKPSETGRLRFHTTKWLAQQVGLTPAPGPMSSKQRDSFSDPPSNPLPQGIPRLNGQAHVHQNSPAMDSANAGAEYLGTIKPLRRRLWRFQETQSKDNVQQDVVEDLNMTFHTSDESMDSGE